MLGRVFRLAGDTRDLSRLFDAFTQTVPFMTNIALIIAVMFYTYAIVGVTCFGNLKTGRETGISTHVNFADFHTSFLTLFRVLTRDDWSKVLESVEVSPPNCDLELGECGIQGIGVPFFVSFLLGTSIVAVELYTAVILEYLKRHLSISFLYAIESWNHEWSLLDTKCHGRLHVNDFLTVTKQASIPFGMKGHAKATCIRKHMLGLFRASGVECRLKVNLYSKEREKIWTVDHQNAIYNIVKRVYFDQPLHCKDYHSKKIELCFSCGKNYHGYPCLSIPVLRWYAVIIIQREFRKYVQRSHKNIEISNWFNSLRNEWEMFCEKKKI